jgi:hypothetical protein
MYNHPFGLPPGPANDPAGRGPDHDHDYERRTADGVLECGITDRLNVATPAAYFHPGIRWEDWVRHAEAGLRRGRASQRPVYVFLNPDHFNKSGDKTDPGQVEVEQIERAVEFCRGRFDGVVFWGGWLYQDKAWVRRRWDEDANWLVALRKLGLIKADWRTNESRKRGTGGVAR